MSNVHVSIVKVQGVTATGGSMLVETSQGYGTAETKVSSGSSSGTTLSATAQRDDDNPKNYAWRIANMGTDNIYVAFGAAPTASATGKGIPAGAVMFFSVEAFGDIVAVINA